MSKKVIYLEDAITAVNIGAFSARTIYGRTDEGRTALHETVRAIKALPPAEPQWIPCSERLPEEGHDVLITKKPFELKGYEQYVIKAKRATDPRSGKIEWWSPEFGTLTNKSVLAWMPLPKPYEERRTE